MCRNGKKSLILLLRRLLADQAGSITMEAVLGFVALLILLLGVIDFGLAYKQKMGIENAVKAGIQYSIVRKPIQGNLTPINNAVIAAAPTPSAGQSNVLTSSMFCECANGVAAACLSTGGTPLICADGSTRRSFIKIKLSQTYKLLFPYPAFGNTITLSNTETVRLN